MAEALNAGRTGRLIQYALGLYREEEGKRMWREFENDLKSTNAAEVMYVVDRVLSEGPSIAEAKPLVSKLLNACASALEKGPDLNHTGVAAVDRLLGANKSLRDDFVETKLLTKRLQVDQSSSLRSGISEALERLAAGLDHYTDLENLWFPVIERRVAHSGCLRLMWSIHDDARQAIKTLLGLLSAPGVLDLGAFNRAMGTASFAVHSLIFREERVLLPAILPRLTESDHAVLEGSHPQSSSSVKGEAIALETGTVQAAHLEAMFRSLPVDVTLVGADDRVLFFSDPPHRIFPRTPAILGRRVADCHPPESVAVVERILEAFKSGKRDRAEFTIDLGGRWIAIEYFALRDPRGAYVGTLEVSQDVTRWRNLDSEHRLLDWED